MVLTPASRKKIISAYIILNFATVLWVNSAQWRYWARTRLSGEIPASIEKALDTGGVLIQRYSALTGLWGIWEMFNYADRSQFLIFVKAEYADSTIRILPLPWQSQRTFWQRRLFDVKVGKFFANMGAYPNVRYALAGYLCKTYGLHNGSAMRRVIYEQRERKVLDPRQAREKGYHLEPEVTTLVKDILQCP